MEMKKTISVIVENNPGVLARCAGLFSSRNFNIESLAVGETEDKSTSRMTIVAKGESRVLEQILKQLNKLIDVIKVFDMTEEDYVEREMVLIKVNVEGKDINELMHKINIFRAKVLDVTDDTFMIEVTGTDDKINSFIGLMGVFGIKEVSRTGIIALARAKKNNKK